MVMEHPHLTLLQKGILHVLAASLDWQTGKTTLANATIARFAGTTPRSVQRALHGYDDKPGLIEDYGIVRRWHNRHGGSEFSSTFSLNVNALANPVAVAKRGAAIGVEHAIATDAVLVEMAKSRARDRVSPEAWESQPELAEMWAMDQVPFGHSVP